MNFFQSTGAVPYPFTCYGIFFQIPDPTHNICWESSSTVVKLILKNRIIYLNQLNAFLFGYSIEIHSFNVGYSGTLYPMEFASYPDGTHSYENQQDHPDFALDILSENLQ
jgi:hypothetical protein